MPTLYRPPRKTLQINVVRRTTLQMTPTAIAAFVSLALCLAFAETRWIGIVVVVVLGYFFPMLLLAAAVIALLAACAFHYF